MKEEYIVEYTKVNYFNNRKVREKHYHQSLDDVFGILRYIVDPINETMC